MQPCPGDIVAELSARMETLAATESWGSIEEIAAKLPTAVMQVPETKRRETVQSLLQCVDKVQVLAQYAKRDVTDKLCTMRRGKAATAAYLSPD